ncbi:hypothetical protein EIP91_004107 [Steccherinum ochraceum]|uniref:F-box domain-containing protein n=1 Tax=Steccherinum ochraceum TaxID=92696 RepID=A0A4R0RBX5_9APHY|nr:hypothetical protein EIP91_004107 [Steccherinum ochraceum]
MIQPSFLAMSLNASFTHSPQLASHLPVDVVADIVDHLAYDQQILKACSLISRSWVHPTRVHLFNRTYVESEDDGALLSRFLQLLNDSPHICAFVRQLVLATSPGHRRYSSGARVAPSLLVDLLKHLPHLHTIEFCGVSFAGAQFESLAPATFSLDHVAFTDVGIQGMDTAHDWTRIFSVFSCIKHLSIHTELPHVHRLPPNLPASFVKIAALTLKGITRPAIMLEFLSKIVKPGCLKSLDVAVLTPEHVSAFGSFVSTAGIGDRLQEVRLDLTKFHVRHQRYPTEIPPPFWSSLQLAAVPSLQTITLATRLDDDASVTLSSICDVLAYAPPTIKHVNIAMSGAFRRVVSSEETLEEASFSGFTREVLVKLEEVVVTKFGEVESVVTDLREARCTGCRSEEEEMGEEMEQYIVASMPRLSKRGVLAFTPPLHSCKLS